MPVFAGWGVQRSPSKIVYGMEVLISAEAAVDDEVPLRNMEASPTSLGLVASGMSYTFAWVRYRETWYL